jgi:hypothetical protein
MDGRSKKLVDLFNKIQAAIGQGDVCGQFSMPSDAEPDVELTVRHKKSGQVVVFHLWRAEIEQWRDIDPLTKTPITGYARLKIIGDTAKVEQTIRPKQAEPREDLEK